MLPCAILLVALVGRQDAALDAKVTFTCAGLSAPQLIEQLSQATHIPLFAPKAFQTDVIAVRVKDATLRDLMSRIGDVTAAVWEKGASRYELVRSMAKVHAEEQATIDQDIAVFQREIEKQRASLAKLEPFNEDTARSIAFGINEAQSQKPGTGQPFDNQAWQKMVALDARAPGGRAMARVMAALNAKSLATLPIDYKVVFSDQPTAMQRPLPPSVLPALKDLVAEQNLWADVSSRVIQPEAPGGIYSSAMWMNKSFQERVGKVLLMVAKTRHGGNFNVDVELAVADGKGRVIVRGRSNLNTIGDVMLLGRPQPEPNEVPLEPSPLVAAMLETVDLRTGTFQKPLSKNMVDLLLHPEQQEPLAVTGGDLCIKIGNAKSVNLVAELTDESFELGAFLGTPKPTPSMLLKTLSVLGLEAMAKDGWLIVKPLDAPTARSGRIDRAVLGPFLRATAKKGRASLDDLAHYATTVDGDLSSSLGMQILTVISPREQTSFFDPRMLKLYGLLDASQRQTLTRGAGLPISSLGPAQLEIVGKMVFGQNANLQRKQDPNKQLSGEEFDLFYNGIYREPTELFGQGLPVGSTLALSITSTKTIVVPPYRANSGIAYGSQDMGPDEIAMALYAKERPGIFPWMENRSPFDQGKFNYGTRRMLNFTFDFGNVAQMTQTLQDATMDFAEPVPYDQIPEDFKREVQARLQQMRKDYANLKPGQFGISGPAGSTPPPPP